MRIKWMLLLRRTHLFLSVFFSPLLLMFIVTGWWQTVTSDDDKEKEGGFLHELIKKFSNVHTDSSWPQAGHHSTLAMKIFVVSMCVALIISITLGLCLAWQTMKGKWRVVLAFLLGILIPALALYLA